MKYAVVDIGTNTVLMLVAEVSDNDKSVKILSEYQEIPRLGRNVDSDGRLGGESIERVIKSLKYFKTILQQTYPDITDPVVTATSAVRDASNRDQFVKRIDNELHWRVQILSGEEEANLTYSGALSVLNIHPDKHYAVLDIGGGSTELATGRGRNLNRAVSLDLGCVRFSERYFKDSPPLKYQVREAKETITSEVSQLELPGNPDILVGVAGTVTSIAGIELKLETYDPKRINGFLLDKAKITDYIADFSATHAAAIEKKYLQFLKGRGDVIVAGLLILSAYMDILNIGTLRVSTGGIRHGVLIEELNKTGYKPDRLLY